MTQKNYPIHPAAELFPMMTDVEFEGLKEDIRQHGQRDDIMIWNGLLVDGRNRLRACNELGIEPSLCEMSKELDPVAWVLSHNLHRRHLTTAQRAMVADKLATLKHGEKKADSGIPLSSQTEAAKALHVSNDSVKMARKVRTKATPEVIAAVERGELSLNAAVETTKPKTSAPAEPAKSGRGDAVTNGKPTEPAEKKTPTLISIERTLIKLGKDKKRHPQLIQIVNSAMWRLTDEERGDVLSRQLVLLSAEDLGKVYDDVETRQQTSTK